MRKKRKDAGRPRIDLSGQPLGIITDTEVAHQADCSSKTAQRRRKAQGLPPVNGTLHSPIDPGRLLKIAGVEVPERGVCVGASLVYGLDALGLLSGESRGGMIRRFLRESPLVLFRGRKLTSEEPPFPRDGESGRITLRLSPDEWTRVAEIALAVRADSFSGGLRALLELSFEGAVIPTRADFERRAIEACRASGANGPGELARAMGLSWGKGSGKGFLRRIFIALEKSGAISFSSVS